MTDRVYLGIQKIIVNSIDETNVLDIDMWPITDNYDEDLVEVKFTPNVIAGVGFKQWAKGWLIKVVHDGKSDVWDSYLSDTGEGAVIPNFTVVLNIVKDPAGKTTEVWTFEASKSYIANRDELKVAIEQERTPGAIFVVCIGDVEVTHV